MGETRFMSMRELRASTGELEKILTDDGKIIVTNRGKPIAMMIEVNESNLEEKLIEFRREKAKKALRDLQAASVKNGLSDMTMEEIDAEIKAAREERRNGQ